MKTLLFALLLSLLLLARLCCWADAAPLTVAWNDPESGETVTGWTLYRGIEELATVTRPQATVRLPAGDTHVLTVRARNSAGISPASESLTLYLPPDPVVTVQFSENLTDWTDQPFPAARFYRAKIVTP